MLGVTSLPASLKLVFASTSTSATTTASFSLCTSIPAILYAISSSWREPRACRAFLKQGRGLSPLPPGRDNAAFIRSTRTLRIRQDYGLDFSTAPSISPLPTTRNDFSALGDFHRVSRAVGPNWQDCEFPWASLIPNGLSVTLDGVTVC